MDKSTKNRNTRTPMLNIEYYFDQNRKAPYIVFCGMVLPFFILKNKLPIEINMGYDVRETETLYNDKPSEQSVNEMVSYMDSLYKKFSNLYFKIESGEDYRENLAMAYFYQELAETIIKQNRNENLTTEQYKKAVKITKLYCAMAGLSAKYVRRLEKEYQWQS